MNSYPQNTERDTQDRLKERAFRVGARVRIRPQGETGTITFIDRDDEFTIVVDGYEGSNTFKRSNLEEIPK